MTNYFRNLLWGKAYTLYIPKDDKDRAERCVQMHSGGGTNPEERPFKRQLDLWAMCVAVAAARDLEPRRGPISRWGRKFVDTRSVPVDEHIAGLLCVLAVSRYGVDSSDALDPGKIVELGNRLAGAGCPILLDRVFDAKRNVYPMTNLIDFATELSGSARQTMKESSGAEEPAIPTGPHRADVDGALVAAAP